MIKIENKVTYGWEAAIRGMRNPMNSWEKSDSKWQEELYVSNDMGATSFSSLSEMAEKADLNELVRHDYEWFMDRTFFIGNNDLALMKQLVIAGTDHSKFMRMINVTCDITAPLYWWKEFDTYKVGTVRNSCSTMHKIADKEFTLDDFSHERLICWDMNKNSKSLLDALIPLGILSQTVDCLNEARRRYLDETEYGSLKEMYWWQMIQLLPSSYNQRATVQLNYAVLRNMYHARKNHKLDEWREFCEWIETLPYSELMTMGKEKG